MAGAGVEMNGRLDADRRQDASGMWDVSLSAGNPDPFKLEAGNRVIRLNGFDVTLQGTASPDSADVLLKCGTSAADMETTGFKSGPVRLTLPLKWPASGKGKQGKIQTVRPAAAKAQAGLRDSEHQSAGNGSKL